MQELFRKYLNNLCSPEEVKEVLAYFNDPENEPQLRRMINETLENTDADDDGSRWSSAIDETFTKIKIDSSTKKSKLVPIYRRTWITIAVAAIVLVGTFASYNLIGTNVKKPEIVKSEISGLDPKNSKAILTLADGSSIALENVEGGTITQQGATKVVKTTHGVLTYKLLTEKPTEVLFNILTTPRGGKCEVILGDGTKVWLNSASSLRFPAAFSGTYRKVELKGEAYFEVAKNSAMPFKVAIAGKGEVEVIGTHFNVNAYSDESTLNTTLLKGSVKVTGPDSEDAKILKPGEQAQISQNGKITIAKNADIEQAIGWKNGTFSFSDADVSTVMRQLSRWYDVDVIFEGPVPQRKFNGEIQLDLKLSQVLKLLEMNNLRCRLNGKTLIVQQS